MPPRKKAPTKCSLMCCTLSEAAAARVTESLVEYRPGLWAEKNGYGPACHCGLRSTREPCPRHRKAER